ncbi:uncharacterized protein LOC108602884 [Drosophila busckii]|uniref:uncharacterized protein LOC108602884 n=1 Tax=Drosophila busckii TaxID=30019 RepID=UPI00083ED83D|nr:uncharacterized protein LOC108602884 [Drosophila busckii]
MAFRLVSANSPVRSLFKAIPKVSSENVGSIRHFKCNCDPSVPFLEKPSCVFSKSALLHHWGAIPIIIFTVIGFSLEVLYTIRLAFTRDDVWYTKGPAACEVVETRRGYPPPIRKMLVYNQKYENDEKLLEALQGNTSGPEEKKDEKNYTLRSVAAHSAITLGALALIMM